MVEWELRVVCQRLRGGGGAWGCARTCLQPKPCNPARRHPPHSLACSQSLASQCAAALRMHSLAAKALQASARTHLPAPFSLQPSALAPSACTSLQPFPCNQVRRRRPHVLACSQSPAGQCAAALACALFPASQCGVAIRTHLLAAKILQASALPSSARTCLHHFPCKPVRHRPPHALACSQSPASQCTVVLRAHSLVAKTLQPGALAPSARTCLHLKPCNPARRRTSLQPREAVML